MLYGILIALSGALGGGVVAMYYRWKAARHEAKIIGLEGDAELLRRDVKDAGTTLAARDKVIKDQTAEIEKMTLDYGHDLARKNQLIKDKDDVIKNQTLALRELRARDPDAVAAVLGSLFPPAPQDGGEGGDRREGSGGAGLP